MKELLFLFLILISLNSFAQKTFYNLQIQTATDSEIVAVRQFWNSYVQNCILSYVRNDENLYLKFWNNEELKAGFTDIIMYNMFDVPLYLCGNVITFDIQKVDNEFFRIRSLVLTSDSINKSVLGIFNLYAKNEGAGYKLYNAFYFEKSKLNHFSTQHFDFYYPSNYNFNKNKIKETENFYTMFSSLYDIKTTNKINYIIGNNIDEANSFLGFDFSLRTSSSKNGGYILKDQHILVSCQLNHYHEIVHSIIESKFPNPPLLFNEGIATYYAGTRGEKFDFHIEQLKEIINSKPESDLSNFDQWQINCEDKTDPFYTIGAIFIDYAFRIGGPQKVLALLKYSNSNEGIYSAISSELGIERDKIDSFLKEYLTNYRKKVT